MIWQICCILASGCSIAVGLCADSWNIGWNCLGGGIQYLLPTMIEPDLAEVIAPGGMPGTAPTQFLSLESMPLCSSSSSSKYSAAAPEHGLELPEHCWGAQHQDDSGKHRARDEHGASTAASARHEEGGTAAVPYLPLSEIRKHDSLDDAWIIIDYKVYDVSAYARAHPGGWRLLVAFAGRDATTIFNDVGHSRRARRLLASVCIGEVAYPRCETILVPIRHNSSAGINRTGDASARMAARVRAMHHQFRAAVWGRAFPCVGAKACLHSGTYTFRCYSAPGAPDAVARCCADLREFIRASAPQWWARGGVFTSFVAAFVLPDGAGGSDTERPPDAGCGAEAAAGGEAGGTQGTEGGRGTEGGPGADGGPLWRHLMAMSRCANGASLSPRRLGQQRLVHRLSFFGWDFFVPWDSLSIRQSVPWAVLVLNPIRNFALLEDELAIFKRLVVRRDARYREMLRRPPARPPSPSEPKASPRPSASALRARASMGLGLRWALGIALFAVLIRGLWV